MEKQLLGSIMGQYYGEMLAETVHAMVKQHLFPKIKKVVSGEGIFCTPRMSANSCHPDEVSSKKGVKNALWRSAGHSPSSPWGGITSGSGDGGER